MLSKKKIYEDLKEKNRDFEELMKELSNRDEEIAKSNKQNTRLREELENVYATLKTIKEITKDKTIETLCVLKMQDIKNTSGVYIYEE